jgi:rSAM/selenodomain-associated transferase 1
MARHPEPGTAKTRLAARIGAEPACRLYRAFVLDLAERLDTAPHPVTWLYTPPDAPFEALLPGRRCRPQAPGDLGAKLDAAIRSGLDDGAEAVLVVGADAPHLPIEGVAAAADALVRDAVDLVLGPATDGGYYLIGVRAPAPALLRDMPWSTATVLDETLRRARVAKMRTRLLAPLSDVDTWDDAVVLHAAIGQDPTLARTRAVLDALVVSMR